MSIYLQRRKRLVATLSEAKQSGVILLPGHTLQARNYAANAQMPFRQNSHFLYYFGLKAPGFVGAILPDGRSILFGEEPTMDDIIWEGALDTLSTWGERASVEETKEISELGSWLRAQQEPLLYLKPYQGDLLLRMASWLERDIDAVRQGASHHLAKAICDQRMVKSDEEIAEIEAALSITAAIYQELLHTAAPSIRMRDLYAHVMRRVFAAACDTAYPPIMTTHGEILHTHDYDEVLEKGRLLLLDIGAEAPSGYASDITRTIPVSGIFTAPQLMIYDIVLRAQWSAIAAIRPHIPYRDIHLIAARVIAEGLTSLGLMKGDPQAAVAAGAHALFFPHGIGHTLGLDVHDMEDLGDIVGYSEGEARSTQFGLNFLRFARPLQQGFVMTVEPGIYFIPSLIQQWKKEGRHKEFIAYERLEGWFSFGGIRIEDDILVTSEGSRILGQPIPKIPEDLKMVFEQRDQKTAA